MFAGQFVWFASQVPAIALFVKVRHWLRQNVSLTTKYLIRIVSI
jgi:hypothetical protein